MKTLKILPKIGFLLLLTSWAAAAEPTTLSPRQASSLGALLDAAVKNSQKFAAARSTEKVVESRISLAKTGYMPTILAEAIDSTGFAGSTGLLGVGGIMGSPYRSGLGYGIVATQPIYDFGRTSKAVESAEKDLEVQKSQTTLSKSEVMQNTLDAYLQCSLATTQIGNWTDIQSLAGLAYKEIEHYVHTGQRSVVESSLARSQVDEAIRAKTAFENHLMIIKQRLSVMTGRDAKDIHCPEIAALDNEFALAASSPQNPLLTRAQLEKQSAEFRIEEAKANYRPKLIALGSLGEVQDTRVVSKQDYALGVALIFPLFDGNKTNSEVERAQAFAEEKSHEVKAVEEAITDTNLRFDEIIRSTSAESVQIKAELNDLNRALKESRERYFTLKGNLADLRETIRNLVKVRSESNNIQAQLLRAQGLKAIYNGAYGPR
jgi:outer membrane protein TolC